MDILLIVIFAILLIWIIIKVFNHSGDDYNRGTDNYNRNADNYDRGDEPKNNKKSSSSIFSIFSNKTDSKKPYRPLFSDYFYSPFDKQAIKWCANLLNLEESELKNILEDIPSHYKSFRIGKRSGGYRIISAPNEKLLNLQKTIYNRILLSVNIHPTATGFRKEMSIVNNAKPHLGKDMILKMDIMDFFGSIHLYTVTKTFEKIGYPKNISEVLAALCCLKKKLPQGAPTSPALSNIVAYEMDKQLTSLSKEHYLTYTRYADDMTFSGDIPNQNTLIAAITKIVKKEGFAIKIKKTRFLPKNRRKIVTGISISSGEKMTIPKAKKRELRKNIHFILTKGLAQHQRHIKSNDPAYLKRILGYLSFWLSIEPDNQYVIKSIKALKKLQK